MAGMSPEEVLGIAFGYVQQALDGVGALKGAPCTITSGDGFNDAPALASSDIGISLRSGADLAAEASDVTLMHDDLKSVVDTILILKRIRITIKQNMAWAFIFNGIMVFLSAGILYPICGFIAQPQWSIAAVAFATFSIAVNSLLLKRMRL